VSGELFDQVVAEEVARRNAMHAGAPNRFALSEDYETIGLHGEITFGERYGLPFRLRQRPGDGGKPDFYPLLMFTLDVKTFRNPKNLIVKQDTKNWKDIYVLGRCYDGYSVRFIGWEWGATLKAAPVKPFPPAGVLNHYVAAEELQPMSWLENRLPRFTPWRERS
jgi:hypothetical protein